MRWANFLHIYQPAQQAKDILRQVVNESYRPVFSGLREIPNTKLTLNISGALAQLLVDDGYNDVIENIRWLAEQGHLEFTGTAMYHAFLPALSAGEVERQIRLNDETNLRIFGDCYQPKYFFPPEMAISQSVAEVVSGLGYRGLVLDEISWNGKIESVPFDRIFTVKTQSRPLEVVFRNRRLSNLIISAIARSADTFKQALGTEFEEEDRYLLTAMDGETFGHHRPGLEKLLFELLSQSDLEQVFISEISGYYPATSSFEIVPATWAASEYDIEKGIQFHSWDQPGNQIHALQWQLFHLVSDTIESATDDRGYEKARTKLDPAIASDQFFWASNRPWWSIEMIESGAWLLLDALGELSDSFSPIQQQAKDLYFQITGLAFRWQREGKIRKEAHELKETIRIPFKARTLEQDKPEVYRAFMDLMNKEMLTAAEKKDYERAIMWRDAIWKIETKNDIYDAIHATDVLRNTLPIGEIEALMDTYKKEYRKLRGGQAEQRDS